ncbi:MAG: sugar phosphate isomerase/epimerase [Candidatus Margulisiibacteriota bacterium]
MNKNGSKNPVGIMQGRLSPSLNGKIQFFPWKTWENEFAIAASLGLSEIEFIFDHEDYPLNPIFGSSGVDKIKRLIDDTGVKVNFICADYFMEKPFFHNSRPANLSNVKMLNHLIYQASKINAKGIEIPLVDNSSIKTGPDRDLLIGELSKCLDFAERFNIQIGLETDLSPKDFKELLQAFSHPLIKANYDVGNSASSGYDVEEEFNQYGTLINNIHIKDRLLKGGTVPLGTGSAHFDKFFDMTRKVGYKGSYIFQTARGSDEIETVKNNMAFIEKHLKQEQIKWT